MRQYSVNQLKASEYITDFHLKMLLEEGDITSQDENIVFFSQNMKSKYQKVESIMNVYYGCKIKIQIPQYTTNLNFIVINQLPFLKYLSRNLKKQSLENNQNKNKYLLRKTKSLGQLTYQPQNISLIENQVLSDNNSQQLQSIDSKNNSKNTINSLTTRGIIDIPKTYKNSIDLKLKKYARKDFNSYQLEKRNSKQVLRRLQTDTIKSIQTFNFNSIIERQIKETDNSKSKFQHQKNTSSFSKHHVRNKNLLIEESSSSSDSYESSYNSSSSKSLEDSQNDDSQNNIDSSQNADSSHIVDSSLNINTQYNQDISDDQSDTFSISTPKLTFEPSPQGNSIKASIFGQLQSNALSSPRLDDDNNEGNIVKIEEIFSYQNSNASIQEQDQQDESNKSSVKISQQEIRRNVQFAIDVDQDNDDDDDDDQNEQNNEEQIEMEIKPKKKKQLTIQTKDITYINPENQTQVSQTSIDEIIQKNTSKKKRGTKAEPQMQQKLIQFYKDTIAQYDIPIVSISNNLDETLLADSNSKEYLFFWNLYQMLINQGLKRYKDVLHKIVRNSDGDIIKNMREVKHIKFSQEYLRKLEKIRFKNNMKQQNRKSGFFSVFEDAMDQKILKDIKKITTSGQVRSSIYSGKLKLTNAIIRNKINRKEQIRFMQNMRQIGQQSEDDIEIQPQEQQNDSNQVDQNPQDINKSENINIYEIPEQAEIKQNQLQFQLPQKVIMNFYHYFSLFSKDECYLPLQKSLQLLLKENNIVQKFIYTNNNLYSYNLKQYKLPPVLHQFNLNPIEICLLVKTIKPQDIGIYFQNIFAQSFSTNYATVSTENLENLCRSKQLSKPIVIFSEDLHSSIYSLIEIKMIKIKEIQFYKSQQLVKNKLVQINLHNENINNFSKKLEDYVQNGDWVIVTGIKHINQQHLPTIVNAICQIYLTNNQKNLADFRLFILYEYISSNYKQSLNHISPLSSLNYLFSMCHKTYINSLDSVKKQLSRFYFSDINDHIMNVEKVLLDGEEIPSEFQSVPERDYKPILHQINQAWSQKKIVNDQPSETKQYKNLEQMYEQQKRENCQVVSEQFINLHTFVKPDVKNEKIINMILNGEQRNKFNILMVLSIIRQRQQHIETDVPNFQNLDNLYTSDIDFYQIITDLLNFISYYKTSPFRFICEYFAFLYKEKEQFHVSISYDQIIRLLFQDFLCYKLDRFRVIDVCGKQYPLYKYTPEIQNNDQNKLQQSQHSEKIFLNIMNLPNQDPIELLGFGQNFQIAQDLKKSQEMMRVINQNNDTLNKEYEKKKHAFKIIERHYQKRNNTNKQQTHYSSVETFDNQLFQNIIKINEDAKDKEELISLLISIQNLFEKGEISLKFFNQIQKDESLHFIDGQEESQPQQSQTKPEKLTSNQKRKQFLTKKSSLRQSYLNSPEQFTHVNSNINSLTNVRRQSMKGKQIAFSFVTSLLHKKASDFGMNYSHSEGQSYQNSQLNLVLRPLDSNQGDDPQNNKTNITPMSSHLEINQSTFQRKSIMFSPDPNRSPNAQQYILIQQQLNQASPSKISEQIQNSPNNQTNHTNLNSPTLYKNSQFNRTCLYDRIKDHLPVKKKAEKLNAQKDVLKTFSQMHKLLREKPKHIHSIEYSKTQNNYLRNILVQNDCINLVLINEVMTCNKIIQFIKNYLINVRSHILRPPFSHIIILEDFNSQRKFLRVILKEYNLHLILHHVQKQLKILFYYQLKIVKCILQDIKDLIMYLNQTEYFSFQDQNKMQNLIQMIKNNKIPEKWDFYGMLPPQKSLMDFLKLIAIKYEHIYEIVVWRNCQLFPSISLYKMFDPFSLIHSLLYDNSKKSGIPMHMLKIKLCKLKRPPVRQNPENGICIRGITLRAASLNPENDYLQEESMYEFEQELSYSIIKVEQRTDIRYDHETYIPIEFMDQVHSDLESRYIEQQEEYMNNYKFLEKEFVGDSQVVPKKVKKYNKKIGYQQQDIFGIQSPTRKKANSNFKVQNVTVAEIKNQEVVLEEEIEEEDQIDIEESNVINFIKLPVVSCSSYNTIKNSHMKLYFFFKSNLPQSFWAKRGTHIYFHKVY